MTDAKTWKVGDKCWVVFDDGDRRTVRRGEIIESSFGEELRAQAAKCRSFIEFAHPTRKAAKIAAAEIDVQTTKESIDFIKSQIVDARHRLAKERAHLVEEKKRLAALKAVGS